MFVDVTAFPSTGSAVVDAAHARIGQLINRAHDSWRESLSTDQFRAVLSEVLRTLETHFRDEEQVIRDAGYEGSGDHVRAHREILRRLIGAINGIGAERGTTETVIDVLDLLDHLVFDHSFLRDQDFRDSLDGRQAIREAEVLVTWTPTMATGHLEVDRQHEDLASRIESVREIWRDSRDPAGIADALPGLLDVARRHFTYEEALLSRRAPEKLDRHKSAHFDLLTDVTEIAASRSFRSRADWGDFLASYLSYWFTDHVLNIDKEDFLRPGEEAD